MSPITVILNLMRRPPTDDNPGGGATLDEMLVETEYELSHILKFITAIRQDGITVRAHGTRNEPTRFTVDSDSPTGDNETDG